MADRVGTQIGNYRLSQLLGKGGFAEVYLGQHVRLGTQAAIKLLLTRLASQQEVDRFQQEAQTIAHLDHPHIVRVLDFDVVEETPFLVMSYAPNGSLRQRHSRGTRLPLATIITYVQQIANALQYGHHQRVIHRDIKPENLLVSAQDHILLADFGIAVVAETTGRQRTQEFSGTAAYAAPEQLQGKPQLASDQYALGIVVYEWLTGACPFQGSYLEVASQHVLTPPPPLRQRDATIPPQVEHIVLTALEKDPKARFASVQAFATTLSQAGQTTLPVVLAPTQVATPQSILLAPTQIMESPSSSDQVVALQSPAPPQPKSSQRARQPVPSEMKAPGETAPDLPVRSAKVLAFLSYLSFSVIGVLVLCFMLVLRFKKNQSNFLRFHAVQSILLTLFLGGLMIGAIPWFHGIMVSQDLNRTERILLGYLELAHIPQFALTPARDFARVDASMCRRHQDGIAVRGRALKSSGDRGRSLSGNWGR